MEKVMSGSTFTKELVRLLEETEGVERVVVEPVVRSSSEVYLGLKTQYKDTKVVPVFNVANLYNGYCEGTSIAEIKAQVMAEITNPRAMQIPDLTWDNIKDKVFVKIQNKRVLRKVEDLVAIPFKQDMVLTFVILVQSTSEGIGTIPIKQNVLELIGVDEFTLYKTAKENVVTGELKPTVQPMRQFLLDIAASDDFDLDELGLDEDEIQAIPEDSQMFVVSNHRGIFGANQILNTTLLTQLAEQLDSDLAVLPSSIHEMIVLPVPFKAALEGLTELVKDVNRTMVAESEQLSDYALFFDRKTQTLS